MSAKKTSKIVYEISPDEKLKFVISEITQGLKNLSDSSKSSVAADLSYLQEEAESRPYPLVEYALLLFRKYANITTNFKGNKVRWCRLPVC